MERCPKCGYPLAAKVADLSDTYKCIHPTTPHYSTFGAHGCLIPCAPPPPPAPPLETPQTREEPPSPPAEAPREGREKKPPSSAS